MSGLQIVGIVFALMFVLCVIVPMIVFRKRITWRRLGSTFNPFGKFGGMISLMAVFLLLSLAVAVGALFDERWLVLSRVASVAGLIFIFLFLFEMFLDMGKGVGRFVKGAPIAEKPQSFLWKDELGVLAWLLFLGSTAFLNNYVLGLV